MRRCARLAARITTNTHAVTSMEYALIAGLIAVAIAGAVGVMGGALQVFYTAMAGALTAVAALVGA